MTLYTVRVSEGPQQTCRHDKERGTSCLSRSARLRSSRARQFRYPAARTERRGARKSELCAPSVRVDVARRFAQHEACDLE